MKKVTPNLLKKAAEAPVISAEKNSADTAEANAVLAAIDEDLPEFILESDSDEEKARKTEINARIDAKNYLANRDTSKNTNPA